MTLTNLKKRVPSVERPVMSVDDFIDDAEFYQRGLSKVVNLPCTKVVEDEGDATFKRATFTLGETAIQQLSDLSHRTGIAKSRLIRIWLHNEAEQSGLMAYITSPVK